MIIRSFKVYEVVKIADSGIKFLGLTPTSNTYCVILGKWQNLSHWVSGGLN